MKVGVLALQGDHAAHVAALRRAGSNPMVPPFSSGRPSSDAPSAGGNQPVPPSSSGRPSSDAPSRSAAVPRLAGGNQPGSAVASDADGDIEIVEVRRPSDLEGLAGLVVPGGESTTLLKLLEPEQLGLAIRRWVTEEGGSILGTCAGAILVSTDVRKPQQASLGLLDAAIERNAYGRQVDSFIAPVTPVPGAGLGEAPLEAVFIRAPRFVSLGKGVEALAMFGDEPVLVRQGRIMAATFHPELTQDARVHGLFLRALVAR